MTKNLLGIATGFIVLITGVVVAVQLARPTETTPLEPVVIAATTSTTSIVEEPPAPITAPKPALPDVAASISRVLSAAGNVELASQRDLSQLPQSVSALLEQYNVVLRVPTEERSGL